MHWAASGVEILQQDQAMSLDNFLDALSSTHGVSIVDDDHAQELYLRCLAEVSGHTILDDYSAHLCYGPIRELIRGAVHFATA
eukprot:4830333-Karenia_brevis.AAC.1